MALTGREIERAYVGKGSVGHAAPKPGRVFKPGQKRGVHGQIKRELRPPSAIIAAIVIAMRSISTLRMAS